MGLGGNADSFSSGAGVLMIDKLTIVRLERYMSRSSVDGRPKTEWGRRRKARMILKNAAAYISYSRWPASENYVFKFTPDGVGGPSSTAFEAAEILKTLEFQIWMPRKRKRRLKP